MQQTFVRSIIPNYVNKLTNLVLHSPKMKNKILERPEIEISKDTAFQCKQPNACFVVKAQKGVILRDIFSYYQNALFYYTAFTMSRKIESYGFWQIENMA